MNEIDERDETFQGLFDDFHFKGIKIKLKYFLGKATKNLCHFAISV